MTPSDRDERTDAPSLAWVIVDGAPRRVSEFADLAPRRRPRALCPVCGRVLVLKLGSVRRHHAAHAPGDACAAAQPETALHLNCKFALAATLRTAQRLTIRRRCVECARTQLADWASAWTEVLVESRVEAARRPDIVLRRDAVPIGAIEIVVSHKVDAEKARALAAAGVPWIEVIATAHLAEGAWSVDEPLDVWRSSDALDWRCEIHQDALDAAAESGRHTTRLEAARVVDLYEPDGKRSRFIYRVAELSTDGVAHTLRLQRGGLHVGDFPNDDDAWPKIRIAFMADVRALAPREGMFADSPMRWATGDAAANIVEEAWFDRAGHDPTPLATRFPRRWFFGRDAQHWFLPDDMRDVKWDRPEVDAFAPHPASRRPAAVRERPVSADRWNSQIFAARPIAGMFRARVASVAHEPGAPIAVITLTTNDETPAPTIVVIERPSPDDVITDLASSLADRAPEALWLSHPRDWTRALAGVTWCPAGRDERGRGVVAIDSVGVFTADQFSAAVVRGDQRVAASDIRRRMADRVRRLGES
jgi:hypothetical protein